MFRRVYDQRLALGTGLVGYFSVAPADLVATFGEPDEGGDGKVSGEYIFRHEKENVVFTLYDWEATTLYTTGGIHPDDLWAQETPFEFNIGGSSRAPQHFDEFLSWLKKVCK